MNLCSLAHKIKPRLAVIIFLLLAMGCSPIPDIECVQDSCIADTISIIVPTPDTPTEAKLREQGLVDIQEIDPTIAVALVYATPNNFVGKVLYADLNKAFVLPQLAQKVAAVQANLHELHPDWNLLILDAARPLKVQYEMFHLVAGTSKNIYVANPLHGPGMHNYGAAVDVTIVDANGNWIDMGTEFDHFGPESHIEKEDQLLSQGSISPEAYANRRMLRQLMRQQGLIALPSEWWHFNLMSVDQARKQLKVIDI